MKAEATLLVAYIVHSDNVSYQPQVTEFIFLYEFQGVCQQCASQVSATVHNGELLNVCEECKEPPFELTQYTGLVYILKNQNQQGVKIGKTTKTVEQRAKQLSATGVPGKFEVIAIFPTKRPDKDEKKIHDKLASKRLDKEHFDLEPVEAALKTYRILNKAREPIFYDDDLKKMFYLKLDKAKIEMEIKLAGKKK